MKYKMGMKEDKKRMGMMYGAMPNTRKKAVNGMKVRKTMDVGGLVKNAMNVQTPN